MRDAMPQPDLKPQLLQPARSNFWYTRNTGGSSTPDITNNRTDYVLRQMRENGLITAQQYNAALDRSTASVLEKSPASTDMYAYPHYVEYAISDVVDTFLDLNGLEDTSANRYAMENKLRTGGYSVTSVSTPKFRKSWRIRWQTGATIPACATHPTRCINPAIRTAPTPKSSSRRPPPACLTTVPAN